MNFPNGTVSSRGRIHQGHSERLAWCAGGPLEDRRLGAVSINVPITAVRKLAIEATDDGLVAPELAAGITRVKGTKSKVVSATGCRSGRHRRFPRLDYPIVKFVSCDLQPVLVGKRLDFVTGRFGLEWTSCGGFALRTDQMALKSTVGSTRIKSLREAGILPPYGVLHQLRNPVVGGRTLLL
jgi:hypothetical protein